MDDAHRQSLIDLLVHDDPEHRQQGVVLLHSLGAEAASQLFAAPRVERDRPAVSWQEVPLDAAGRPLPRTRGERGGASSNAKD